MAIYVDSQYTGNPPGQSIGAAPDPQTYQSVANHAASTLARLNERLSEWEGGPVPEREKFTERTLGQALRDIVSEAERLEARVEDIRARVGPL